MGHLDLEPRASGLRRRGLLLIAALGWMVCAGGRGIDAARAADVDITTSTTGGVDLDGFAGATAEVFPGVSVSNTTFTLLCSSFQSICATTQAWTLTNNGTIGPTPFGNGVDFAAGGAVVNAGSIDGSNGIWIAGGSGGSVDNHLGATIHGKFGAIVIDDVPGMVTNAGSITSDGQAVGLNDGGILTNLAGGLIQGHGESNAAAVILGTSREVINSGTIQSNDTGFATGVSLQNGILTNEATGEILGAYNGVWANGSAATDITNAGLIEASKAAAMFGTPGSAIEADGGGVIANSGIIRSTSTNGSDVGIFFAGAGSITNSGTIESLDGGLAISFNGVDTHTLTLATGSLLVGDVQGGTGTDNLVLKGKGSEAIDKFLGFETLSLQGTDWVLTGDGSFLTNADIARGRLHVNGILTVPTLSVLPGGTLGGIGEIVGAVNNNGVIAPGNSIGTLTASDVSFGPHSILAVEIDPRLADKLVVTGTAAIDPGARVMVLPAPGTYGDGQEYLILDAGARNGTFGGIIENSAFLDFGLDNGKDANQVWLDITRVATFPEVAATPNQVAAASGLEALGPGNPIFDAIELLAAAPARKAFDLASGELHASVKGALLEDSRFVREAVIDRLRQRFDADFSPADPSAATLSYADEEASPHVDWPLAARRGETVWSSWGQGFGSWGDFGGDGNAAAAGRSIGGFVVGADATVGETWRFGIAGGYQSAGLDIPDRTASASIEGYHLAAYGGFERGPLALRLGGAYTWYDVNTDRSIAFPGFSDSLSASYHAQAAQAFGEVGYAMRAGALDIEPFGALAYVNLDAGGFRERGGAAALTGRADSEDITFTNLGSRFSAAMPFGDGRAAVHGMVAWQHALDPVTPASTLAFNGGAGTPFTVAGIPIATDAVALEAGFDWALSDRADLALTYAGQIAERVQDHGLKAKLSVRF